MILLILFCLLIPALSLSAGPWPTLQHDFQHTGRTLIKSFTKIPQYKWKGGVGRCSPIINSKDEIIYESSLALQAFEAKDGKTVWQTPGCKTHPTEPSLLSDGSFAYYCSPYVFKTNQAHQVIWSFLVDDEMNTPLIISPDESVVYIASTASLYAVHIADGSLSWQVDNSSRTLSMDISGYLYMSQNDRYHSRAYLNKIAPDGKLVWQTTLPPDHYCTNGINCRTTIDPTSNTIYLTSHYDLLAFSCKDGSSLWNVSLQSYAGQIVGTFLDWSALSLDSSIIYTGSTDGNLYAISITERKIIWQYNIGASVTSPIVDGNDIIFAVNSQGDIYAFNKTGSVIWSLLDGSGSSGSGQPAIGNDGTLYFGSGNSYYDQLNYYALTLAQIKTYPAFTHAYEKVFLKFSLTASYFSNADGDGPFAQYSCKMMDGDSLLQEYHQDRDYVAQLGCYFNIDKPISDVNVSIILQYPNNQFYETSPVTIGVVGLNSVIPNSTYIQPGTLMTLGGFGFSFCDNSLNQCYCIFTVDYKVYQVPATRISDTIVTCKAPKADTFKLHPFAKIALNLRVENTSSYDIHYQTMDLSSFTPSSADATGGTLIKLKGFGFSICSSSCYCVFNHSHSSYISVISDNEATCVSPNLYISSNQNATLSINIGDQYTSGYNFTFTVPQPPSPNYLYFFLIAVLLVIIVLIIWWCCCRSEGSKVTAVAMNRETNVNGEATIIVCQYRRLQSSNN